LVVNSVHSCSAGCVNNSSSAGSERYSYKRGVEVCYWTCSGRAGHDVASKGGMRDEKGRGGAQNLQGFEGRAVLLLLVGTSEKVGKGRRTYPDRVYLYTDLAGATEGASCMLAWLMSCSMHTAGSMSRWAAVAGPAPSPAAVGRLTRAGPAPARTRACLCRSSWGTCTGPAQHGQELW